MDSFNDLKSTLLNHTGPSFKDALPCRDSLITLQQNHFEVGSEFEKADHDVGAYFELVCTRRPVDVPGVSVSWQNIARVDPELFEYGELRRGFGRPATSTQHPKSATNLLIGAMRGSMRHAYCCFARFRICHPARHGSEVSQLSRRVGIEPLSETHRIEVAVRRPASQQVKSSRYATGGEKLQMIDDGDDDLW